MTLFYTSQQQQQQQNHNIHGGNLNNITQRTSPTTTTSIATSESTLNMSSAAAGEATSANAATTVTTSATTNLVAASTTPTTTDLPDIIAPFPKKFLYAYAGHLLNNGNNNNFISTQVAPTATNANNINDQSLLTTSSLLQLQLQHQQQHQQLQQQLQQQKLQLQQIQQKMTSHTTTTTAPTTEVTNDSPWGLSAVQEDSEDDNLNNNINNNGGDTLESMSDEALACAELMEIMGNSSRGSSRPVSLSGSPDRFSSSIINSSNISNINKKFIMKSTTKSMEELKISDNKNNIINDFYDDNDKNENIVTANVSNSYDELKAIEIEKMRQRPFTISTSTLNTSSSSASGSTTTSPTTVRPSRLAVDNSHLLFGSSPITRAHNPLPMDSYFSPTKQRSKQFPHNHNQQQLLRPTSLYQTNHYYYDDNNNKNDNGIEGETNFYDGDINNENAASDITKVGGISRMINNLNDNSFENVSKIPHNLSKASKTAIFMSISEGGRRRSLSVGSAGLKTGSKIIGC